MFEAGRGLRVPRQAPEPYCDCRRLEFRTTDAARQPASCRW